MDFDPHNVMGQYILIGQTPVPEPDLLKWAQWMKDNDRRVDRTQVGPYDVSTVFLGVDHNWMRKGPPILFETLVFSADKSIDMEMDRCSTWIEAEEMHARMVKLMQEKVTSDRNL